MVNPIGSQDHADFKVNVGNLDKAMNDQTSQSWADRFGVDRLTWFGIESKANEAINGLAFQIPVDYAAGLNVNANGFTVTYNGVVYAPKPSAVPFTTGAWDAAQWYPIQNVLNQKNLLVFDTYAEASTVAATLPDGQTVDVDSENKRYKVLSGALVFFENIDQLRQDLSGVNGAGLVGYTPAGTGAVAATVQSKLRESVSVKDFGAVGDGVTDDTAAIQAAINSFKTNGIPILLNGNFRVTAPLQYQTQGNSSGLRLVGTGVYTSSIIADFVGATLFNIDGSSLLAGKFQFCGGFSDLKLTTASGAAVENAITCNGWWYANHSNLQIGNLGAPSFTKNGIYIPLRTDISSNPDDYASVVWNLNNVQIDSIGEYGIYGANNTGYAGWTINGGGFNRNGLDGLYVNTNGWSGQNFSSSYNGRYGINYTGSSGVTLTSGYFRQVELDGNSTAGLRISRVNSGIFQNLRLISRVLSGVQKQLVHVLGDNSQVLNSVEMTNFYHRVESGITSAVTLYDFGGATSNVSGNIVSGYRLLNSAGVTVTEQTTALLDRRFKNYVDDYVGNQKTASPTKFAHSSESAQAITTTLSTWIFNTSVQSTGWTDYNTTTGILTAPHNGFYFFNINFNLTSIPAGERIIVSIYRAGSEVRFWYFDWPSGVGADRWAFNASDLMTVNAGQELMVKVQATIGGATLFGTAKLDVFVI